MKYTDATLQEVNAVLNESQLAFLSYKNFSGKKKAEFLRAIADEIEALGQELVTTTMRETNLPEARIINERGRTTGHCRMFADLVEDGSWVEARVDTAIPDRTPAPKPDRLEELISKIEEASGAPVIKHTPEPLADKPPVLDSTGGGWDHYHYTIDRIPCVTLVRRGDDEPTSTTD
jgi:hypothetical protein